MRIERITILDENTGKGIDVVCTVDSNGRIVNKHIDHLRRTDWGAS